MDTKKHLSASVDGYHIAISGNGEYLESNEIEFDQAGNSKIVKLRIMKKLDDAERLIQVLQTEHSMMLKVIDVRYGAGEILVANSLRVVPLEKAGHWVVLEYSVVTKEFNWYYSEERIPSNG